VGTPRLEIFLDPEDLESSVAKAAKYLHRNPADPADSRWLLRILADVLFGDRKKGRRRGSAKWHMWRLVELDVHRNVVERDNPGISDRRAAAEIKQRYPQYRHDTVEVVRRRLNEARGYARLHKWTG
jgi:hypothetical protein